MRAWTKTGVLVLATVAVFALAAPARAHSFNVALVIPQSEAKPILEGFMLATKERDGHPDEESDGHLGGLDVYVTVIDGDGDLAAGIAAAAERGALDIVTGIGQDMTMPAIVIAVSGQNAVLLPPGNTPFAETKRPGVAAFMATYESDYGISPNELAAWGYNAARRIARAVREQGGTDDKAALAGSFEETRYGFDW